MKLGNNITRFAAVRLYLSKDAELFGIKAALCFQEAYIYIRIYGIRILYTEFISAVIIAIQLINNDQVRLPFSGTDGLVRFVCGRN